MPTITHEQAFNIAMEHHSAGRLAEAEAIYRQLLGIYPNNPDLWHLLGVITGQRGDKEGAVALIRKAIAMNPGVFAFQNNIGLLLTEIGRIDEALAALETARRLQPDSPAVHYNLGIALCRAERANEAVDAYRTALRLAPEHRLAKLNLGNALVAAHRRDEAITHYETVLQSDPTDTEVANNLGNFLRDSVRVDEAIGCYRQALAIAPHDPITLCNLGTVLKDVGDIPGSIAAYRQSLALDPSRAEVRSNLIFCCYFDPAFSEEALAQEFREWERRHGLPLRSTWRPHTNDPSPERKLRIGYVSPDLRDHAVGRTLLPCFEAHDRDRFEFHCYSGATSPDAYTELFRRHSAGWRETANLSEEQLAEQIRADGIDLLVDLALHTAYNRLLAFARKPAPVQIAWLGYPGSTGLAAMDCRITDRYLEPEGSRSPALFEEPLRLPDGWCSFCAPEGSPEPGELPALRGGGVTFGSFNNFAKINPCVVALWARILEAVDGSRLKLILKGSSRAHALHSFAKLGIAADRIEFLSYYPSRPAGPQERQSLDYLDRYRHIDIALDPFPYNGMTTTCDALWMGVPVVALIGRTPMSRASFSLLSNTRLPELAAQNEDDYVRIATALASDLPRLSALRATLRERMKQSPLLDAARLTRGLEAAFREAWQRWCDAKAG